MAKIVGCKVFSVETVQNVEQDVLGERITKWMNDNAFALIEDRVVVQSNTHISIMIFYSGQVGSGNPLDG